MNKDKISSQEIIDQVASQLRVSKRQSEEFLKEMFVTIEEALLAGESVKIKNFGTFKLQWNEPRKSVNVQTGEEIILDGYNKVAFTPDVKLKDIVNEPFAHLEPLVMDDDNNEQYQEQEQESIIKESYDPLHIFTEQASEIKEILSEINALSSKNIENDKIGKNSEGNKELVNVIPDFIADNQSETDRENSETEITNVGNNDVTSDNKINIPPVREIDVPETSKIETVPEVKNPVKYITAAEREIANNERYRPNKTQDELAQPEILSTPDPFTEKVRPNKNNRKGCLIFIIVVLLLTGAFIGNYYLSSATRCWIKYTLLAETNTSKISKASKTVFGWFKDLKSWFIDDTVIDDEMSNFYTALYDPDSAKIKKDTVSIDTIAVVQTADSLQMLFDQHRIYTEFIAEERINEGSRLTLISEKYYGLRDFWVYIYEANLQKITDPDRIPTGTIIRIPKLDERLIDKNNLRCVQYAKQLRDLYVGLE